MLAILPAPVSGPGRRSDSPATPTRISAALFSGAIAGGIVNPLVDDIDDATLRAALIQLTQRMLKLPD